MPYSILRLAAVKTKTGLSRSTIYMRVAAGTFPHSINLGARAVGWLEADVDDWIAKRVERSVELKPNQNKPKAIVTTRGRRNAK